ncbi:MAG TPA: OmpH family outer membrane protein [Patescibacteria group bacterium]|nr:OmpH family outer membrane protein [Patescibacteria group bacterium]
MKRFFYSAFFAVSLLSAPSLEAQNLKIGIVDTEMIVKQMPEAIDADSRIKDVAKKYQDSLEAIQRDFTARLEQYKKGEAMMTADAKRKAEDDLKVLQQQYMQFEQEKFGATGEIARVRENFLAPLRKKVQTGIEAIAKEEKMSFVFDKSNPVLMYAEEKYDITFRVIDRIKRGGGK